MKIETKRLILKDLEMKDANSLAKNANNLLVSRYLALVPYPYKFRDAKWFISKCLKDKKEMPRKSFELGIVLKSKGKVIGMASLTKVDKFNGTATLGSEEDTGGRVL